MGGHSYILLYLVTITNKMTVLSYSCYRLDEWQIKLVKKLTKIT